MGTLSRMALTIDGEKDIGYKTGVANDDGALLAILDMVYLWAGIIGVVVLVVAGLLFVTSRGDANQMKRSKDAIRGTVIGLIVVMVAFSITRFVIGGVQG